MIFLRKLLMPPNPMSAADRTVFAVMEIIAFALGWDGIDRLLSGRPLMVMVPILLSCIVVSYAGFQWPALKRKLNLGSVQDELPEFRPRILPVAYAKAEKKSCHGLYIRNAGYDALDVEIPNVSIGKSGYNLVFPDRLAQFGERSGNAFLFAQLDSVPGEQLTQRSGGDLREIMVKADVESAEFSIAYKDTDFRSFCTDCLIERTTAGLEVKAIRYRLARLDTKPETKPARIESLPSEPEPTLLSLLDSSIPNTGNLMNTQAIQFQDGTKLEIKSKLYFEFRHRATFLGFYVPSSPKTMEAIAALALEARSLAQQIADGGLKVIATSPGENPEDISSLTFTGKVYVHHEDHLTHRQIADAEDSFKAQDLVVVLRGPDFLSGAWIEWKRKSASMNP
jgi:hypothetical protein